MKNLIKTSALGLAALTMSACTEGSVASRAYNSEAGAMADSTSSFGNATMNNNLVHRGVNTYAVNLSRRFAEEVPTTINFGFNSTALSDEARATLRVQADWIRQFPEVRFTVYGHTDLVGSASYNRNLGLRRAQAAVLYLTTQGISRSRLEAVVTRGETQPLIVTEGRERANRRTVTDVSGFVENHPMVLNGKYAQVIFREYVTSARPASTLDSITGSDFGTEQ